MTTLPYDRIEPGAIVRATDGHLGTVKEIVAQPDTGEVAYLVINRGLLEAPVTVPATVIDDVPTPREVRLAVDLAAAVTSGAFWQAEGGLASARDGTLRIPLLEERVQVYKRPVDLGELVIRTGAEEEPVAVEQPVMVEDLIVERTPIGRVLTEPLQPRSEGDWLVIPIMREEVVVTRRLVLDEEVRIRKRLVTENQVVRTTVRRTRLEFDDATVRGVQGLTALGGDTADQAPETSTSR